MSNLILPDSRIIKPKVVPVNIKRLTTKNGLGHAAKYIRIGDEFLVDITSIAKVKITLENGKEFDAITIHIIDVNGKDLGWMYAEFFFVSINLSDY